MDFTLQIYRQFLDSLIKSGYSFQTVQHYMRASLHNAVIIRHDIDKLPVNSLQFAKIQADNGIKGTYYIRTVQHSYNERIIKDIASLGHEIGYHYEDISRVVQRQKTKGKRRKCLAHGSGQRAQGKDEIIKNYIVSANEYEGYEKHIAEVAFECFSENLEKLRKIVPVKTICMHGSPMSRWDSRLLWKYYDYRDLGILGEPYFDINFDDMLYLTDTGRRWDGGAVSIRDKGLGIRSEAQRSECRAKGDNNYNNWKVKPVSGSLMRMSQRSIDFQNKFKFRSTHDLNRSAEREELPDKIMMTFHPQRWTDKPLPWAKELVWQNVKNVGKYFLVKLRDEEEVGSRK